MKQPHIDRRADIESQIRYEEHDGIHTYHPCRCGRGLCRSGPCATCLREELARLPVQKARRVK